MTRPAHVTDADVRAAQAAMDAMGETSTAGEARAVLMGFVADVRAAGYLEGVQEGRREAANVVIDALRGEGLSL
jgi:hypothetical protein